MNIRVDVRELVLTGVEPGDAAGLCAAVSAALTRLVRERGLPTAVPGRAPQRTAEDLPTAVAEEIWAQLGRPACRAVTR